METINTETTDMANIYTVNETKLDEFQLNPRNIRSLDSIKIVPIEVNGSRIFASGDLMGFSTGGLPMFGGIPARV